MGIELQKLFITLLRRLAYRDQDAFVQPHILNDFQIILGLDNGTHASSQKALTTSSRYPS